MKLSKAEKSNPSLSHRLRGMPRQDGPSRPAEVDGQLSSATFVQTTIVAKEDSVIGGFALARRSCDESSPSMRHNS
jgi:hypothetical protein